MRKWF